MAIVKIQRVKNLKAVVNYSKQEHKTKEELMTTFGCNLDTIERDFKSVLNEYNKKKNTNRDVSSRMIIQSFSDENLTPEMVHDYGVEFADNYLKGNHQYAVITHVETDNLHNHIIFNDINFNDLVLFDSKRSNTLHKLRDENDKVSEKYGLKTIEKGKENRAKSLSFNEYVVRGLGKSFKEKLEYAIDINISKSKNYDEFIERMENDGFESKEGKYLAFKNKKSGKNMRTKTLGVNYFKESIKYRIENKEYTPAKVNVINKKWIDKTEEKFKNNKALNNWATKQNIQYLNELNSLMYRSDNTKEQILEIQNDINDFMNKVESKIENLDSEIHKLENMKDSFEVYKSSYNLMITYKKTDNSDKPAFKKQNYSAFKKYDLAKKDLNYLRKEYRIADNDSLENKISELKDERKEFYQSLDNKKEKEQEKDVER